MSERCENCGDPVDVRRRDPGMPLCSLCGVWQDRVDDAYAAGLEAGRAAERTAVVHWLDTSEEYVCDVAKQIDRGDHTEGPGPAKGQRDADRP